MMMRTPVVIAAVLLAVLPQGTEVKEIRFHNESVTLVGSLYLPSSDEAVPGVMMIQGSGTSSRDNDWARTFAEELSDRGYAVVLPDKRGSGDSGGDWQQVGFDVLAGDAISGAATMREHPAVDATRVGYLGLSQGGRVAPLAARMDARAAFAVSVVSSVRRMEDSLYDGLELAYRRHGLDAGTIEYLQGLARYSLDYIRTGEGWDDYIERHREISSGPLSPATETWPTSQDDPYWDFWRQVWDYDPMPHWRHLVRERDVPSLLVYGEGDRNVNVDKSLALAAELEPDPQFEVHVYEGGGHALWDDDKGGLRDDMLRDLERWLGNALDGAGPADPVRLQRQQ